MKKTRQFRIEQRMKGREEDTLLITFGAPDVEQTT
jgi:hypothetical protein